MASREARLLIDARPHGPHGPLAAERILGQSVLERLLDLAAAAVDPSQPIQVHARPEDERRLRGLAGHPHPGGVIFVSGAPASDAAVLESDRIYDPRRLRRGLKKGKSPDAAVIWRLDRPETLAAAEDELRRRSTYQPLGSYWAFPLADRISAGLAATRVRPTALTLMAAALMLGAALMVGIGATGVAAQAAVAGMLALALVLDTADGRLARLQGTASAFGRWLDQVLDELADLALHAAIAWTAFVSHGSPWWLVLGILYASGKYLFLIQSLLGDELEASVAQGVGAQRSLQPVGPLSRSAGPLGRLARLAGHADVRWHLWIVLAAWGRLEVALVAYALYFPTRALAGMVRKGARHG